MGQRMSSLDPLIDAAFEGDTSRLTQLLDAGANPTRVVALKHYGEVSPVAAAIHGNHLTSARKLLEKLEVKDIDQPLGTRRMTALHIAAAEGRDAICEALLVKGADPRRGDTAGNTVLHIAVMRRRLSTVWVILHHGASVHIHLHHFVNHKGQTALQLACENGDLAIVNCLLNSGADPDTPIKTRGRRRTPIWSAVDAGSDEVAMALLMAGCKIESDARGETLMHAAVMMNRPVIVRVLMEHGVDIETGLSHHDGYRSEWPTPLLTAVAFGRLDCLKEMLNASRGVIDRCLEKGGRLDVVAPVMETFIGRVPETPETPMTWAIQYPCSFVHRSVGFKGLKTDVRCTMGLDRMTLGHFGCVEMMLLCGTGMTSEQLLKLQYHLVEAQENGEWTADHQRLHDLILSNVEQCMICRLWGLWTEEEKTKERYCSKHYLSHKTTQLSH